MSRHLKIVILCSTVLLASQLQANPDPGRLLASALAQQADVVGEVVELTADGRRLLAVYEKSRQPQARGAILLLHAPGGNADDSWVIRPLRLGLSQVGWNTLALQLPPAFDSDSPGRWLARNALLSAHIDAGLSWLQTQGQRNQVLLSVGASASGALAKLGQAAPKEIQALVLVSAPLVDQQQELETLAELTLPVLDIFAERDRADIVDAAPAKRRAAAASISYRQRTVPGASAGYAGATDNLVTQVGAWLAANTDGRTVPQRQ